MALILRDLRGFVVSKIYKTALVMASAQALGGFGQV